MNLDLSNNLLIATPLITHDSVFHRSLIYLDQHGPDGSLGLIVNKPSEIKIGDVLQSAGMEKSRMKPEVAKKRVYVGGPVNTNRMHILYLDNHKKDAEDGQAEIRISSSEKMLFSIGKGIGPSSYMVLLGCASWDKGQLQNEIAEDSWICTKAVPKVIFDTPADKRLYMAARHMGFNINMLVSPKP